MEMYLMVCSSCCVPELHYDCVCVCVFKIYFVAHLVKTVFKIEFFFVERKINRMQVTSASTTPPYSLFRAAKAVQSEAESKPLGTLT